LLAYAIVGEKVLYGNQMCPDMGRFLTGFGEILASQSVSFLALSLWVTVVTETVLLA